jgi:HK97 family phage major capsid protein
MITQEEFAKLSKEQQDALMKKVEEIKNMTNIVNDTTNLPQLSMKDFEGKIKEVFETYVKQMTPVDRKYFMFPGIGHDNKDGIEPQDKFKKTISFLGALIKGDTQILNAAHLESSKKAKLSENSATAGGFLVPEEFLNEILRLAPLYGVLRSECRVIPMNVDVLKIPKAGTQDVTAIWIGEGGQIKSTDPNFGQALLSVRKLGCIPKVTNELLEDANVDIINYLSDLIAQAFAKEEDNQGFNGVGSPFVGLIAGTGAPTYPNAGGTNFNATSYPDIVKAAYQLYDNAKQNAKYYLHRSMIGHLHGLITTTGAPIFPNIPTAISGYPIRSTEIMPSLSGVTSATDGSVYGIFGNLGQSIAIGDRKAITMKISTEATVGGDNLFEQDMIALRCIERIAIAGLLPSAYVKMIC